MNKTETKISPHIKQATWVSIFAESKSERKKKKKTRTCSQLQKKSGRKLHFCRFYGNPKRAIYMLYKLCITKLLSQVWNKTGFYKFKTFSVLKWKNKKFLITVSYSLICNKALCKRSYILEQWLNSKWWVCL